MKPSLLIVMCLALSSLAHADDWSKTYSITAKPDLLVETSDANIRVETWDENKIEARVTTENLKIGDGGLKIEEHQTGDRVELHVRFPHEMGFGISFRNRHVDVEIHMPRQGRVGLHTGDGNIQLSDFKGDMDLGSGDGNAEIEGVDGRLTARSGDGHIQAAGRFDELNLSSGDGRVEAHALAGSSVASSWSLHTGDGSVTVRLPSDFAADMDLHTGDGHITLDLPLQVEGRFKSSDIHGKLNGGGKLVTIHTGDGSITVEKL